MIGGCSWGRRVVRGETWRQGVVGERDGERGLGLREILALIYEATLHAVLDRAMEGWMLMYHILSKSSILREKVGRIH